MSEEDAEVASVGLRIERAFLWFVREPTLWPVLLVVIGHAVVLVAPLALLAFRDGSGPASVTLAALAGLTGLLLVREIRLRRRVGALGALALVTWLLGGGAAVASHRWGLF